MSDNASNPSNANKSPGKGGKSLELMQQRLMAQSQQQGTGDATAPATAPDPAATAPAASAAALSRPKGKDFAAMSARAPKATPAPSPPSAPSPATAAPSRPKGKDFSAMASRMGGPPPPQQQQPPIQQQQPIAMPPQPPQQQQPHSVQQPQHVMHHQSQQQQRPAQPHTQQANGPTPQERARAAQMQAAARAAAGMPPLKEPTATSIAQPSGMAPPHRPGMPSTGMHQRQVSGGTGMSNSSGGRAGSTGRGISTGHPHMNQGQLPSQQQQQLHPHMQPPVSRQASYGQARPSSSTGAGGGVPDPLLGGGTPVTAPPTMGAAAAKNRAASASRAPARSRAKDHKPSSVPAISESRLTGSAQHAPLLGAKITDLVRSIDPNLSIEPAAEEQVLHLVDDFVDKVVKQSMRLAAHRGSKTLDVSDIQLILDQQWGIKIPGLGAPQPKKKVSTTSTPAAASSGVKRKPTDKGASAAKAAKTVVNQTAGSATVTAGDGKK